MCGLLALLNIVLSFIMFPESCTSGVERIWLEAFLRLRRLLGDSRAAVWYSHFFSSAEIHSPLLE